VSYTIVGVLAPSDTPWDRALFVPLASYWEVHQGTLRTSHRSPWRYSGPWA
jgi:hypothetical protein